ncbi:MAG: ribosomal-protein-alanine N-acetyltransferase [Arenicella sp.]|jgi:ribosomal-protein-alanine N-acetyltransferase
MFYLDDCESERLVFKPLTHAYDLEWGRFLSDPINTKHYPKMDVTNPERPDLWIQIQMDRYAAKSYGMCAVHLKANDAFIGQAGALIQEVDGEREIEVGYHFFSEHTGKGYATEAAAHFKNWAFKNNDVDSIISIIKEGNEPSVKVAIRHGMIEDKQTVWKGMPVLIFRQYRKK